MLKRLFFICSCILVFSSCGSSKSNSGNAGSSEVKTETAPAKVEIKCVSKGMDDMENPKSDVVLSINGKETLIKNIYGCNPIAKAEYADKQIPADAVSACGGFWAGQGDYFYVIVKDGFATVYMGWEDEQQEDQGYHWTKDKSYPLN